MSGIFFGILKTELGRNRLRKFGIAACVFRTAVGSHDKADRIGCALWRVEGEQRRLCCGFRLRPTDRRSGRESLAIVTCF